MISVLVDERISEKCLRTLSLQGFNPITLPRHPSLPDAISSHPDSLMFYSEHELFVPAEYCEVADYIFSDIRKFHPDVKINFTADILGSKYPDDTKMNAKLFGNKLLAKADSLSPAIKEFAQRKNIKIINTAQGYSACTTLALSRSDAITADPGTARDLEKENINVTLLQNGDILLPPYEYGFIGGATGIYKNKIFFIGDYKKHRNCAIIEMVLKVHGYTIISLSDEPLRDLGGLIFL